jgi:hypothetical protein
MVWELVWERFQGQLAMAHGFSVLKRVKDVRLSGWARLWIVVFGLIWVFSAWSNVIVERENWRTVCNWPGCPSHLEQKWPGTLVVRFHSDGLKRSKYEIPRVSEESKPTGGPDFSSRGIPVLAGPEEIEVTASDGAIIQFPRETEPEVIARVIASYEQEKKVTANDGTILQFPKETNPVVIARTQEAYEQEQKVAASAELKRRNDLRFQHFQRLASSILSPAMYAVLAFLSAMLAKAAVLWIWRGFNASKEG